jgi:hypothetical protein
LRRKQPAYSVRQDLDDRQPTTGRRERESIHRRGPRSRSCDAADMGNNADVAARRPCATEAVRCWRQLAPQQGPRDQPHEEQAGEKDPSEAGLHRKRVEELHEPPVALPAPALAVALAHGFTDHSFEQSSPILLDEAQVENAHGALPPMRADERMCRWADSQRSKDERAIGADDRQQEESATQMCSRWRARSRRVRVRRARRVRRRAAKKAGRPDLLRASAWLLREREEAWGCAVEGTRGETARSTEHGPRIDGRQGAACCSI